MNMRLKYALAALALSLTPAAADNVDTTALVTLAAQAAGTVASVDVPNPGNKGVVIGVNLTAMTTATVVVHVQGKDAASGQYYDILVGPSLTTTGFTPLTIYPGVIGTSTAISWPLPRTWRVTAVVTGGSAAATGMIGASVIQ